MHNIASCLPCWINEKGCYLQAYGKNHKLPKIAILFDNYGGQNKKN